MTDDPGLVRARLHALGYELRRDMAGRDVVAYAGTEDVACVDTWILPWLRGREREVYGRAVEDENDSPAETRIRLEAFLMEAK